MGEMKLNAHVRNVGSRFVWIRVTSNGKLCGSLSVEPEHAQSLIDYLNAYTHGPGKSIVPMDMAGSVLHTKAEGATP